MMKEVWEVVFGVVACGLVLGVMFHFSRKRTKSERCDERLEEMADMPALFRSGAKVSKVEALTYHLWLEGGLELPESWGISNREEFSLWLLDSGNRATVVSYIKALRRGRLDYYRRSFEELGTTVLEAVAQYGFALEDFGLTTQGVEALVRQARINWARNEAVRIDDLAEELGRYKKSLEGALRDWCMSLDDEDLGLHNYVHDRFWNL